MPPAFPRGLILLHRNALCGEELPAEDFYLSTHMSDCIAVTQAGRARFSLSGGDISGYACMRRCNGLHRLLHLSWPT